MSRALRRFAILVRVPRSRQRRTHIVIGGIVLLAALWFIVWAIAVMRAHQ